MKDFLVTDEEAKLTPGGGATGVVALRLGPSLYLAQAGDSFAFVVRWNNSGPLAGTATIVSEAVRHKPADPLERKRIEKAGGEVMMPPPGPGGTSRVVIPGECCLSCPFCRKYPAVFEPTLSHILTFL